MSETEQLISVKDERRYVRQRVTKLCNKINAELQVLNLQQKSEYLDRLKEFKYNLNGLNKSIYKLSKNQGIDEDVLDSLLDDDDHYDELISSVTGQLQGPVVQNSNINPYASPDMSPAMHFPVNNMNSNKLKLPVIPLPEFGNGKEQSFRKFIRSFENLIEKHNISSYEKFILLRKQLSGGPRTLIDSLDVEEQCFETAKQLLEKAFDSTVNAKNDLIKKLSSLQLTNSTDPYSYIGEVRTVIAGVESLEINMNDVLQYFVWEGLNTRFQEHLVQITNKSNPSITEITDNYFEGTDRYLKQNANHGNLKSSKSGYKFENSKHSYSANEVPIPSTTMAVNIKNNKTKDWFCALCRSDGKSHDHPMRSCINYDTPTKKVDKLKSLKGCIKCSFSNHATNKCQFKFTSNCMNCNGHHMTFLCLKRTENSINTNSVTTNTGIQYQNVGNQTSVVEISNVQSSDAVMLPTFTAHIRNSTGELHKVRVFKDSGCQRVFIRTALSDQLKLDTVDNELSLNIQGFLTSKSVMTRMVRFPLVIGGDVVDIDAVCKYRC